MNDYQEQLEAFSLPDTRAQTEIYFERYWLDSSEYESKWTQVQYRVFDPTANSLPDLMFNSGFEILPLPGMNIFTSEHDFEALRSCMQEIGETSFVVIQNERVAVEVYYGLNGPDDWRTHPLLRFKFPVSSSWTEIMAGGYISTELFQGAAKDYFVLGDTGCWGRYVANSYANPAATPTFSTPLNLTGFRREYSVIFARNFGPIVEPAEWLPESYRGR